MIQKMYIYELVDEIDFVYLPEFEIFETVLEIEYLGMVGEIRIIETLVDGMLIL
jgi:hypothetical protein